MELMDLLKTRRSCRRFCQQPIPQEVIDRILQAAAWASSAANLQPLSYVVIQSEQAVSQIFELTRWAAYLPKEQGCPKKTERPVLFIGVIQNKDISAKCDVDVGLSVSNMTLSAWNDGVASCILGAFDRAKVTAFLGLPEIQVVHTLVAFGYPAQKSILTEVKGGNIKYRLNENGDVVVPKRNIHDITTYR